MLPLREGAGWGALLPSTKDRSRAAMARIRQSPASGYDVSAVVVVKVVDWASALNFQADCRLDHRSCSFLFATQNRMRKHFCSASPVLTGGVVNFLKAGHDQNQTRPIEIGQGSEKVPAFVL